MRVTELSCWRSAGLQFHVVSLDSSHPLDPAQADTPAARAAVRNARIRDLPEVRQSQNDYDKKEGRRSEKSTLHSCRSGLPLTDGPSADPRTAAYQILRFDEDI